MYKNQGKNDKNFKIREIIVKNPKFIAHKKEFWIF